MTGNLTFAELQKSEAPQTEHARHVATYRADLSASGREESRAASQERCWKANQDCPECLAIVRSLAGDNPWLRSDIEAWQADQLVA